MLPDDLPNPFEYLAGEAGKVIADSWTVAMLGLWNAGLWVLRLVLRFVDAVTTPDLSEDGPGAAVYETTFWLAGALLLVMMMVQLGVAAIRRDAKSLATVVLGLGKFVVVWAGWLSYGVALVAACGGLTRALMSTLLKVNSWSAWQPWATFNVGDGIDGTVATVLGLMGLLLWLAAIGHLLVMLTRGGALIILVATAPISAAGLVGDAGRSWFWKSLRWFHAAAFTPVLMVLVLGIGVQMTTGVANGLADRTEAAVGTALPGVVMILVSCFAPLALFKLLAFVDPGTSSGAALRQGLAAQGGLQGLLHSSGADSGANAGGGTSQQGRSQGESAGEDTTTARFTQAQTGLLRQAGGEVGAAAALGLGVMQKVGTTGAAVSADLTNQMGVGHTSYHPDFTVPGGGTRSGTRQGAQGGRPPSPPDGNDPPGNDPADSPTGADTATPSPQPPVGLSPQPSPPPAPQADASSSPAPQRPVSGTPSGAAPRTGGGASGAAGGAEVAATVPIVPV
jgi:hypothetical protein